MKDDYIKIRVTKEQKELFKRIAKERNMTMSKFIITSTENSARPKDEYIKNKDMIESRSKKFEKKILELRNKLMRHR